MEVLSGGGVWEKGFVGCDEAMDAQDDGVLEAEDLFWEPSRATVFSSCFLFQWEVKRQTRNVRNILKNY